MKPYKLAILISHPIQYFSPLYRRIAEEENIDLTVYYCSRQGLEQYKDEGFGETVQWDVPLLEGHNYKFLENIRSNGNVGGFFSLINTEIISELKEKEFDALWVHGHSYLTYLIGIFTAKLHGIKVFMRGETHLLLDRGGVKKILRYPLMKTFYSMLDGFLAIGTRNREFYKQHGVPENKIYHLPYTVNNDFFRKELGESEIQNIRDDYGLPQKKKLILFASKFTERKKPIDLVKAYEKLIREHDDLALVFVGSGEEEENLKNYINSNNLNDVYFLGFRNQSELPAIYEACDIFVLPSVNEPWGLIINEVMSAGLPVIVSREVGSVKDLIKEGGNGYSFEGGNVQSLERALDKLVSKSDGELNQMGEKSREIIDQWSYEECVAGIKNALKNECR